MKVTLDPGALTLGDLEDYEAEAGRSLLTVASDLASGGASAKELVALVWITQRAHDPTFSLEQARKIRLADLEVDVADVDPPTATDD